MHIDDLWIKYSSVNIEDLDGNKTTLMTKELFTRAIAEIISLPVEAQVIKKNAEGLLPCPKCGSDVDMIRIGNDYTKKRRITVKCTNSDCRIERTDAALRQNMEWLEKVAIETWNKRK